MSPRSRSSRLAHERAAALVRPAPVAKGTTKKQQAKLDQVDDAAKAAQTKVNKANRGTGKS